LLLFFSVAYGQLDISRPISFQTDLQGEIPTYACPYFDYNQWLEEDSIEAANGVYSNRVGQYFIANKSSNSFGVWQTIENYKVWKVRLTSENAYALKVTLSNFILPNYTTLFIYSEDRSQVYGPFTANYNTESQVLPLPLIVGETAIIECVYDMTKLDETPVIHIDKVSHIHKNIMNYSGGGHHDEKPDDLWDKFCQNDINCPAGEEWQTEKRAVARIVFDDDIDEEITMCSGALLNDTDESTTIPYFLTANHCINSETEAASATIYFNFERTVCNQFGNQANFNGRKDYFICGSKLKATDISPVSTDFTLLELNSRVPSSYQPFYSGWNRDNSNREKAVAIHHPGGNEKKISFDNNGIMVNQNERTNNAGTFVGYNAQTVWEVKFTDGGTQFGSSGSPLFDATPDGTPPRIIGHLSTGIPSSFKGACRNEAFYGLFSVSWDAGSTPNTQLKHWLDVNPTNPNPTEMEGYAPQG
jgi:hypothetical protein